jgi:hypothetical protein
MKTKELHWKENHEIQTIVIEDPLRKHNIWQETSTENLGELYYRGLQLS